MSKSGVALQISEEMFNFIIERLGYRIVSGDCLIDFYILDFKSIVLDRFKKYFRIEEKKEHPIKIYDQYQPQYDIFYLRIKSSYSYSGLFQIAECSEYPIDRALLEKLFPEGNKE